MFLSKISIVRVSFVTYFFLSILLSYSCVCTSSYIPDKAWPTFIKEPTLSLEKYGSAIAVDPLNTSNNVIILHRGKPTDNLNSKNGSDDLIKEDVVLIVDSFTGEILATWGRSLFVKPHGIEVSDKGDLFVTDVKMHQVFKFKRSENGLQWDSLPEFVLGQKFVSGKDSSHFCSPADVAVLPVTNEFFVADGYCNSRVVKFSERGTYLGEFGAGTLSTSLSVATMTPFNVTHAIAISIPFLGSQQVISEDEIPSLVFVADRNNGRVQVFTLKNWTFLYEITHNDFESEEKNMIFSLSLTAPTILYPHGMLYIINGHLPLGQSRIFRFVVNHQGFKLMDSFQVTSPGLVKEDHHLVEDQNRIENPHDIVASSDGSSLYVIEAYNHLVVRKFICGTKIKTATTAAGVPKITSNYLIEAYYVIIIVYALFASLT